MEDKEFEQEMKKADENRKKEKMLKDLDFDDENACLLK